MVDSTQPAIASLASTLISPRLPAATFLATVGLLGLGAFTLSTTATAQRIIPQPATDSAAQASPLNRVSSQPVNDAAAQASPISTTRTGAGPHFAAHTPISIELGENIDSGFLRQGQDVKAHLSAPLQVHGGPTLPAGTPVQLSVIASVPAGRIMSVGEFSLQILRVGNMNVYTNTLVFDGQPGHQDLPDSNPEIGTDAGLPSGANLTFHVLPAPTDTVETIQDAPGPGSVHAIAPGGAPPASQLKSTYSNPNSSNTGNNGPSRFVSPADTTTNQQVQPLGQGTGAPNQMQSPLRPTGSTTPR